MGSCITLTITVDIRNENPLGYSWKHGCEVP